MSSADIRPVETSKRGVHVLKSYIEYAERGRSAPGAATGRDFDSPFENEVFKRLEARGYKVDVQVGVSNFRIDLGVRHPKQPSAYLCGVECDGAAFHKSRSARDRDCLREEVLKGLGWNLVRIWSTDWFADPDTATEKLVRQIRDLESKPLRDEKGVVFGMRASARADDNLDRGEPESRPMGDTRPEPRADAAARDGEKPRTQSDAQGAPGGRPAAQSPENRGGQDILVARQEPLRRPPTGQADLFAGNQFGGTKSASDGHIRSAPSLKSGKGKLTRDEARNALIELRGLITIKMPSAEAHRCILRDTVIESLVSEGHIDDPQGRWFRLPTHLRSGTDPIQKRLYWERICDILDWMVDEALCKSRNSLILLGSPRRRFADVAP